MRVVNRNEAKGETIKKNAYYIYDDDDDRWVVVVSE
jgi:hypothetical protein